ncbi:MAG TPA: sugar phosphate nucleotidyltransferase [Gemmatimonadaceae bacterium]|nr:sugar phosphate nucleotidyltransferase [Gemmatimonadaceae bacterium]
MRSDSGRDDAVMRARVEDAGALRRAAESGHARTVWGVIPAAGAGSRIQPLAFSKELLPVGSRMEDGVERPRAVSEYLVERMLLAGATNICFVVSPEKTDIVQYYGGSVGSAHVCYTVQPVPAGLCDAIFRTRALVRPADGVIVGLPDTVWLPADALRALPADVLAFLLFPVDRPELFDAVLTEPGGGVREIQVKRTEPDSHWIWGAFAMPGHVLAELGALWDERGHRDEYFGTLVNAYLERGGSAVGVRAGRTYVDVGTLHGYRRAIDALEGAQRESALREAGDVPRPGGTPFARAVGHPAP